MTNDQINSLTMLESVDALLTTHQSIFKDVEPVVAAHTELKSIIGSVRDLKQEQDKTTEAATAVKTGLQEKVQNGCKKIAAGLLAHAVATENKELEVISSITPSTLMRLRDSELIDTARKLHEAAVPVVPSLTAWGVTKSDVDDLGTNYPAFQQSIGKIRNRQEETTTATDNIKDKLKEGKTLLKDKMDKFMHPYEALNPDFYSAYQIARQIIDRGGSQSSTDDSAPKA